MNLSDAIRLGAMLKPQAFGILRRGRGTCALGAAYEAAGLFAAKARTVSIETVVTCFPIMTAPAACPRCRFFASDVGDVVTHLNDAHHWTREQIADFVATVEAQQAPDAVRLSCDQPIESTRA